MKSFNKFFKKFLTKKSNSSLIIRNPYERVVSAYNYLKFKKPHQVDYNDKKIYIDSYKDLNDFIERGLLDAKMGQIYFKPQTSWIREFESRLITLKELDKFIKDRVQVKTMMDIKKSKGPKKLTERSKEIIRNLYKEDFALYKNLK